MLPVSDLTSDRLLVKQLPSKAPGGRSAPPDVELLITEMAALAGLPAQVIELAGKAAIFPDHWETLAEQAMEHPCLHAALLTTASGCIVRIAGQHRDERPRHCALLPCNTIAGVRAKLKHAPARHLVVPST